MESTSILEKEVHWYPLKSLGITHEFAALNAGTITSTWIALGALLILCLIGSYFVRKEHSMIGFLVKKFITSFSDLVEQAMGRFSQNHLAFTTALFIFIITMNWIGLIPGVEEPTKDLNTTLALGLAVLYYLHSESIRAHGLGSYLAEYFLPFNIPLPLNLIAGLALLPLKILEELTKVISLSFRLFGNILGGYIISTLYWQALSSSLILLLIGLLSGINFLVMGFFILFEGFLQAYVFSILALTNIALATKPKE